jgi:crotonobetainyl-CoA:carnitine CoA-transferase CaiB-like acyl-CoA transferase
MSKTPGSRRLPIPLVGEHNREIYEELLGLSQEEIEKLTTEGTM